MDIRLSNLQISARIKILFFYILILAACKDESTLYSYKLSEKIIFNINTGLTQSSGFVLDNGFSYLYKFENSKLIIHDVIKDSINRVIPLEGVKKINSIDFASIDEFAIHADSSFYIFKNNVLKRYIHRDFDSSFLVLPYYKIKYFPSIGRVAAVTMNINQSSQDGIKYNHDFLRIFNLGAMSSSLTKLKYPSQYHENKLGIPNVYISRDSNNLTLSFSFDSHVYRVNVLSSEVKECIVKSKFHLVQPEFDGSKSKKEKLDMLKKNQSYMDYYGICFYDSQSQTYYRIYKPILPENEGNVFLSNKDKGCVIVKYDVINNLQCEYKLPNGVYFLMDNWVFNNNTKDLNYLKVYPYDEKRDVWIFNNHTIHLFGF